MIERFGVQDYSGHQWAQLLQASLAEIEPKILEELEVIGRPLFILERQSSRVHDFNRCPAKARDGL